MHIKMSRPEITGSQRDKSGVYRLTFGEQERDHAHLTMTFTDPEQLRRLSKDLDVAAKVMEGDSDTSTTEGNP